MEQEDDLALNHVVLHYLWAGLRLLAFAYISPPPQPIGRLIWTQTGRFLLTNMSYKAVLRCHLLQEVFLDCLM